MIEQCVYMRAAYPTLSGDESCSEHRHEPQVFALARALAIEFQKPEPSDEQIAWFLDDADTVIDDFESAPNQWPTEWAITGHRTMPKELHGITDLFKINGVEYVLQEAEWEPSHPVKLSTYRSWHDE